MLDHAERVRRVREKIMANASSWQRRIAQKVVETLMISAQQADTDIHYYDQYCCITRDRHSPARKLAKKCPRQLLHHEPAEAPSNMHQDLDVDIPYHDEHHGGDALAAAVDLANATLTELEGSPDAMDAESTSSTLDPTSFTPAPTFTPCQPCRPQYDMDYTTRRGQHILEGLFDWVIGSQVQDDMYVDT